MAITLTEKAVAQVKDYLSRQGEEKPFLRVGVAGGGCGGMSYRMVLDKEFDAAQDSKYEQDGVTVVVDKKSQLYLDGTVIDFHEGIDRSGFSFENPNAVKSCGCGSSFHV